MVKNRIISETGLRESFLFSYVLLKCLRPERRGKNWKGQADGMREGCVLTWLNAYLILSAFLLGKLLKAT